MKHTDAGLLFETLLGRLLDQQLDGSEQLLDHDAELEAAQIDEIHHT